MIIKEDELSKACSTNEKRNEYRLLMGKPEVKRPDKQALYLVI
jgi:hypothetical protein